jgi:hypothetical protein
MRLPRFRRVNTLFPVFGPEPVHGPRKEDQHPMPRTAAALLIGALALPIGACTNTYDPGQRALGGGLLGAAGGAAIGGAVGGGRGAAIGAGLGAAGGAITGAATTPSAPPAYYAPQQPRYYPQRGYYPQQQGYYRY